MKHRIDAPISLGEQDDFFLRVWIDEKQEAQGPTTDPTTAAPTTDGEAPVRDRHHWKKESVFFS